MNKERRATIRSTAKELETGVNNIDIMLSDFNIISNRIQATRMAEDVSHDRMEEYFPDSPRVEESEEALDCLEEAIQHINEIIRLFEKARSETETLITVLKGVSS